MKILISACYSPVVNGSASIRTLYYINNLINLGHEVYLITVDYPKDFINYDEELLGMLDKRVKVHYVSAGNIFYKTYTKKNKIDKTSTKKTNNDNLISKAKKFIKEWLAIPDSYLVWGINSYVYIKNKLDVNSFDIMMSMHEPPSSHIPIYLINKKYGIKNWIAYWGDPWISDRSRKKYNFIRKSIEKKLEKSIVKSARKNVFTTENTKSEYIEKYNINNSDVVYRGYDENEFNSILELGLPKEIIKDKVNFVYTGDIFSELRDLNPFLDAIEKIRKNNNILYKKLNILFIGNIDSDQIKYRMNDLDCITILDRMSYKNCLRYMLNSDVLLIWGNKNSGQIPAKIYDYYGSNSLIYTIIGDEKDPLINFIGDNNKCIISKNQKQDIEKTLDIIGNLYQDKYKFATYRKKMIEFRWDNIVKDLYKKMI